jgi:CheY-like chemotaxis protein
LVVDDEEAIRDVLSRMLSLMGYAVSVAKDGEEGLKVFMECPFDLVLTDLNMPGLDGWALASHIKEKSPQTPVVLITAEDKDGILRKLKESAVDHAIFKPFGLKDIQKMVGKILCDH